jgi:hypothetical protein
MRAWIENDDDITCFIEIDVYEGGEIVEAHGIPCRPLPWHIEFDTIDVIDEEQDND